MERMNRIFGKNSLVPQSDRNCVLFLLFAYNILILCLIPFIYMNHNFFVIAFSIFYLLYSGNFYFSYEDVDLRYVSIFNMYFFSFIISPIFLLLFHSNILILIPFIFVSIPLAILLRKVKYQITIGYLSILFKFIVTIIYLKFFNTSNDININLLIYELFLIVLYYFFIISFLRNSQYSIKRESSNLIAIANRDSLTQLYNRRYLDEYLNMSEKICYLSLVDIDHFKQINDVYGHTIGDLILKEVVNIFLKYKEDGINIVRYGGDEFLFLFENKEERKVLMIMNLIRYDVEKLDFGTDLNNETITVSCGITKCDKSLSTIDNFEKVDNALYVAKKEGRNKVKFVI